MPADTSVPLLPRLGRLALDLLYPPRCALCHRQGDFLCDLCRDKLPRADGDRCPKCWLPWDRRFCSSCADEPLGFTLRSPYRYEGEVRTLVHAFKFGNFSALAPSLALPMVLSIEAVPLPDVIVPVPLSGSHDARAVTTRPSSSLAALAGTAPPRGRRPQARVPGQSPVPHHRRGVAARQRAQRFCRREAARNRRPPRPPGRRRCDDRRNPRRLCPRSARRGSEQSQRRHLRPRGLMAVRAEPTLVLFCGGMGGTPVEEMLGRCPTRVRARPPR